MRNRFVWAAIVAAMLLGTIGAKAELKVKQPCSDGMVLQHSTDAVVWGRATAGSAITVTTSWDGRKYKTTTADDGVWRVKVATPAASYTHHSIKVSGDGGSLVISNVLCGEVWQASGQSNMQMPVKGFHSCPVEGSQDVICAPSAADKVRMYTEYTEQSYTPVVDGGSRWIVADSENVGEMGATAYFFAAELNRMLDVPVGIVNNAYGGSRIESWLPKEKLEEYGTEDLSETAIEAMTSYTRPYKIGNARHIPLKGYTVKGFIWYQGCSNIGMHEQYVSRMKDLIEMFRADYNDGPFYLCEIAPYDYGTGEAAHGALLRVQQHKLTEVVPNTACIVTNDLAYPYERFQIHPCQKRQVGVRLARTALNRDYGFKTVFCEYPVAVAVSHPADDPDHLHVIVENCPEGIGRQAGIQGLEVSSGDGIWHPVTDCGFDVGTKTMTIDISALHDSNCPGDCTTCPKAQGENWQVRYTWGDFVLGNLFNNQGLPFQTFWVKEK